MLLVPRSGALYESIDMNSLAFAGSIFVRRPEHIELVKKEGLLKMLRGVSFPP